MKNDGEKKFRTKKETKKKETESEREREIWRGRER